MQALACVLLLAAPAGAVEPSARDVQSIAAVVNDEIISVFDVTSRLKLVIFSSGLEDTPETRRRLVPIVLRSLIDERLQLQEAERLNISVSDDEIERAITQLERTNELPEGGLDELLGVKEIDRATLESQVRAAIAWGKLVGRRIRPLVDVGKDEIDETIARMEAFKGKPQNLVAEIFLAVDSPDQEKDVRETAERLFKQIAGGASFPALARQFSQSVTAAAGGDLGWVAQGQLDEELDKVLRKMEPPALSRPVRTNSGYHLVLLRDRRVPGKDEGTSVFLTQIYLPVPVGASEEEIESQRVLARTVRETVVGCRDMARVADELGSELSGDLGWIQVNDLPDKLRATVAGLEAGKVSKPVRTEDAILLLMVCDRREPTPAIPDREEVADALLQERVEMMARRYLRDIRRAASVDRRI